MIGSVVSAAERSWSRVLLIFAVAIDALIVLTPGAPDQTGQQTLKIWLSLWRLFGVQPVYLTFGLVEWLANVVMFIPIGLLFAGSVAPRLRARAVPIAAGLSILVELVQTLLPDRVASVYDVAANTLGALLGVLWLASFTDRRAARDVTF